MKVQYFIDHIQIEKDKVKLGINDIEPVEPVIKNTEVFYGDAGIDLFAAYDFTVPAHTRYVANSYIGVLFEPGTAGLLYPRSGDDFLLGAGVIDTGFLGSIRSKIINPYEFDLTFKRGDSIGQLVIFKKGYTETPQLESIPQDQVSIVTQRGSDGRIVSQFNL